MSTFSKEELIRYNRQMMLPEIGLAGQQKIKNTRVLVVGAGGLGCPVLQYLCAAGIGHISIVDFDTIELHNLHRQILFSSEDVGKLKAMIAGEKLKEQNPNTIFTVFNEMLNAENADQLISSCDIIIDGSDNFLTRYLVNDTCVKFSKPLIYGSILGFEAQISVFNYQGSKNLRDLYPEAPNPEDVPSCDVNGVLGTLPAMIGSMMAHETLKLINDFPVLKDELIVFDTREWGFRKISY